MIYLQGLKISFLEVTLKHLERYYKAALQVEITEGLLWYQKAHDVMRLLADKYKIPIDVSIAVCSALSPRCIWEQNIKDAENVFKYHIGKRKGNVSVTTYGQNLRKALNILESNNSQVFSAPKTSNFFQNILDPTDNNYVTIDGHAINAYYGKPGKVKNKYFTPKHYERIARAYKKLAAKYNLLPCQIQAIIWLSFKRIHNIKVNWRFYQQELPF